MQSEEELKKLLKEAADKRLEEGAKKFNEAVKPILEEYGLVLTTNADITVNGLKVIPMIKLKNPVE